MALTKLNFNGTGQGVVTNSLPSGSVLQVVSNTKTDVSSGTSATPEDTGLSATITPSSTSSKIYITGYITLGTSTFYVYCYLLRGTTQIFIADAASNRPRTTIGAPVYAGGNEIYAFEPTPYQYLDSPNTTNATTYKMQISQSNGGTWYVNRTHNDRDNSLYEPRGTSVMTLMEIKG